MPKRFEKKNTQMFTGEQDWRRGRAVQVNLGRGRELIESEKQNPPSTRGKRPDKALVKKKPPRKMEKRGRTGVLGVTRKDRGKKKGTTTFDWANKPDIG